MGVHRARGAWRGAEGVPVVGWVGQMGAAPFCPVAIRDGWVLPRALSGHLVSLSFIFSGQSQEMGLGRGWKQHRRRGHLACCPPPAHHSGGSHILVLHAPGGLGGSMAGGCPHRGARG